MNRRDLFLILAAYLAGAVVIGLVIGLMFTAAAWMAGWL